ncbi:MAG: hypothetical protein AB1646_03175 [Thermodesulfobacteriota bacterium]
MKCVILLAIGVVIWFLAAQFLNRSGLSWDMSAVVSKLKELGSRIHYTVGVLAVILLLYFAVRSLVLAIRVYF